MWKKIILWENVSVHVENFYNKDYLWYMLRFNSGFKTCLNFRTSWQKTFLKPLKKIQ